MERIKLIFGEDVQIFIPVWAGAMVERLRKYSIELARKMVRARKAMSLMGRIMDIPHAEDCHGSQATFSREGHEFKLTYERARKAWILNFAKTPKNKDRRTRSRAPRNAGNRRAGQRRAARNAARPQNARERIAAAKGMLVSWYKTSFGPKLRSAFGIVKLLTKPRRIADLPPRMRDQTARRILLVAATLRHFRTTLHSTTRRKGLFRTLTQFPTLRADLDMRLERRVYGADIGLPMLLSTFVPISEPRDWAAMFGELESERMLT